MTNVEKTPDSGNRVVQPRLLRWLQIVLILLVASVVGDIAVEIFLPQSGNQQGPLQTIISEITSSNYWLRKVIFSVCGGVLYEVLLSHWTTRNRSSNTEH